MPSYTTIKGTCDTAQHQADFDAAVNAVGGAAACVGGQSLGPNNTISQAVNADITASLIGFVAARCPSVKMIVSGVKTKRKRK